MNMDFWKRWERAHPDEKKRMLKNFFGVDTSIVHEERADEYLTLLIDILSDLLIVKNEELRFYNNEGIKRLTEQRNKILTGDYYGNQFDVEDTKTYSGDEYNEDDTLISERINNPGEIKDDK